MGANDDERRPFLFRFALKESLFDSCEIITSLAQFDDVPVVGTKAFSSIVIERQLGWPINRDVVVVVNADQASETQVSCQRGRFMRDAFFETAISGNGPNVVITQISAIGRPQVTFRYCHPDRVCKTLTKGTCCDLYTLSNFIFRVTRCARTELSKLFEIIDRQVVACEVQH